MDKRDLRTLRLNGGGLKKDRSLKSRYEKTLRRRDALMEVLDPCGVDHSRMKKSRGYLS